MTFEQQAFASRLRREREQRGVTLDAIADSTKIKRSLLAAFERGDISKWPVGIFRRAHLRDYVAAIGLQPEPVLTEFLQVFPETPSNGAEPTSAPTLESPLRLTLAVDDFDSRVSGISWRALAAAIDLLSLVVVAAIASRLVGLEFGAMLALVSLAYYATSTAWLGRSFGCLWLDVQRSGPTRRQKAPEQIRELKIVARQRVAPMRADAAPSDIEVAEARLRTAK